MRVSIKVAGFVGLIVLVSLACSQSGEVLTPEEATARAQAPSTGSESTSSGSESNIDLSVEAIFEVDEAVHLVSRGSVVPLRSTAGAPNAINFAPVNQPGTVVAIVAVGGVIWYQVDSTGGLGWVTDQYLESAAAAGKGSETGETASGEEAAPEGPQPGDTVYLTAVGFLVNLVENPGDTLFIAVQERGMAVDVLEVTELEGEIWYFIDAPTGQGWVRAENITTEAP